MKPSRKHFWASMKDYILIFPYFFGFKPLEFKEHASFTIPCTDKISSGTKFHNHEQSGKARC